MIGPRPDLAVYDETGLRWYYDVLIYEYDRISSGRNRAYVDSDLGVARREDGRLLHNCYFENCDLSSMNWTNFVNCVINVERAQQPGGDPAWAKGCLIWNPDLERWCEYGKGAYGVGGYVRRRVDVLSV